MKSSIQRDIYAEALDAYRREVPIQQWPKYRRALSKSGLEKVIKERGHSRFDRKRLDSTACEPILKEMEAALAVWLAENEPENVQNEQKPNPPATVRQLDANTKRLQREIECLNKELINTKRRENHYKQRCALLEAQLEDAKRQHDAFEQHCQKSLRTLHV